MNDITHANYQTVFEIGFGSFPWARVIHALIFVAIGLLVMRFLKSKQIYLVVGIFVVSLASVFFLLYLVAFIPSFVKLRSDYVSGRSSTVEGIVQNFRPAPAIGIATESFSIHGVVFSYNALDDTPCFRNAPFHRGPIRDELDIRIHYNEDCIQRVDIRQDAGPV